MEDNVPFWQRMSTEETITFSNWMHTQVFSYCKICTDPAPQMVMVTRGLQAVLRGEGISAFSSPDLLRRNPWRKLEAQL